MKNAEFVALVIANTNKTMRMRTYGEKWHSGARRLKDSFSHKIGCVVALIQDQIDKGKIVNDDQGLLLYNIQPLYHASQDSDCFVSIDVLIKPMCELNDTHELTGTPLQFVVNVSTGEVMNNTKALQELGMLDEDEEPDESKKPTSYGNYNDYNAICGFVCLSSDIPFIPMDVFTGKLDNSAMIRDAVAFNTMYETIDYQKTLNKPCNWVGELSVPKERLQDIIERGISGYIVKLVNGIEEQSINVTPHPDVKSVDARVEDEVCLLKRALHEPNIVEEELVTWNKDNTKAYNC